MSSFAMPRPRSFAGKIVTLTPVDVGRDAAPLFAISHDSEKARELWKYLPSGPFDDVESYAAFFSSWSSQRDLICFIVRSAINQEYLGSISLMSIRPEHGVAELGNIWFAPSAQRTGANSESCFLLLQHCFEDLNYRRMEWKCNALNEPSRRAADRLGFQFEGIFRQHMLVRSVNRDTAWFSMLDREWPTVKTRFHFE